MKIHFQKVAVIGVGLMGGSLALAIKKRGLAQTVWGVDLQREQLKKAAALGAVDSYTDEALKGVKGADLVVLATPVGTFETIARQMSSGLSAGCIVTDLGSTKGTLVKQMEQWLPDSVSFVGGHPIAGKEKSGIEAASVNLFRDTRCILTPTPRTPHHALEKVRDFWKAIGSEVVIMDPMEHDRVLAAISHLPHMAAYALVNTAMELLNHDKVLIALSGGGFKDFTRIAASSPEMWRDICLHNGQHILASLETYEAVLRRLKQYIKDQDGNGLYQEFEKARKLREGIS